MIVNNHTLYVAINNAFEFGNEKGLIGTLDLLSMTYSTEVDLGPDGKNPDNMLFDGINIFTVNNKDWSGASISKLDLLDLTPTTINISQVSTGCGTSCLEAIKFCIKFQEIQIYTNGIHYLCPVLETQLDSIIIITKLSQIL